MGKKSEAGSHHEDSAIASPTWRGAKGKRGRSLEQRSSQGLDHCLADGEREPKLVLTKKVRPLPDQPGEVPMGKEGRVRSNALPKGSASALPMGNRKSPGRCRSQRLGHRLTNGLPRSSTIASPMGKGEGVQGVAHPKGSAITLPMGMRRDPEQRSSQRLGRCLADEDREETTSLAQENKVMVSRVKVKTASSREDTARMGRV
jgi:hypothetical protein